MPRKPKKTTGAKRRGRASVARRKKKAGSVLVPARKPRGAALAEALAPIFERLQFLDESVRNLWQMRQQMNALSKEIGDARAELQEAIENYRAIEALKEDLGELRKNTSAWMDSDSARTRMMLETESAKWRNAIGSLAANVHDKMEAMRRGE